MGYRHSSINIGCNSVVQITGHYSVGYKCIWYDGNILRKEMKCKDITCKDRQPIVWQLKLWFIKS